MKVGDVSKDKDRRPTDRVKGRGGEEKAKGQNRSKVSVSDDTETGGEDKWPHKGKQRPKVCSEDKNKKQKRD